MKLIDKELLELHPQSYFEIDEEKGTITRKVTSRELREKDGEYLHVGCFSIIGLIVIINFIIWPFYVISEISIASLIGAAIFYLITFLIIKVFTRAPTEYVKTLMTEIQICLSQNSIEIKTKNRLNNKEEKMYYLLNEIDRIKIKSKDNVAMLGAKKVEYIDLKLRNGDEIDLFGPFKNDEDAVKIGAFLNDFIKENKTTSL